MTTSPESSPHGDYTFVPGTEVREPTIGRELDYRPWEAPPTLASSGNEALLAHQYDVYGMIMELVHDHMPMNLPPATKSLATRLVMPREGADVKDYQGNYERSLVLLPEFELIGEDLDIHHKVELGTATMEEIRSNMERIGRRSAELAMLRIVAGHRSEYTDSMTEELMVLLGARYELGQPRKYRVVNYDDSFLRHENMGAMTFEYKQSYGVDEAGVAYDSRHVHVVKTDRPSGFDPTIRKAIETAAKVDTTHIPMLRRVRSVFDDIAATGPKHDLVAASTVKLYMHDPATARTLASRDRKIALEQKRDSQFDSTKIYFKN